MNISSAVDIFSIKGVAELVVQLINLQVMYRYWFSDQNL